MAKKTVTKTRRTAVPTIDFIKGFCAEHKAGGNIASVAKLLDMDPGAVSTRASQLRKGDDKNAAVALPKFGTGGGGLSRDNDAEQAALAEALK